MYSAHHEEYAIDSVKRQFNITEQDKSNLLTAEKTKQDHHNAEKCSLIAMMSMTGGFMVVEFVVGIIVGALTLQADAMHMASDLIAQLIGYWALSLSSKKSNDSYTYGWGRFEVLGAMINAVFLLAVCLNIITEAITRCIDIDSSAHSMEEKGVMYLVVAVLGLVINLLGLAFFACSGSDGHHHHHHHHGHSHGHGHGHDHHDHDHDHDHDHHDHDHDHDHHDHDHHDHDHDHDHHDHDHHDHDHDHAVVVEMGEKPKQKKQKKHSSNVEAVVLHVMGDALGSVAAIISACIINFLPEYTWRLYADPLCSLIIVILILHNCIPLFKSVAAVLLQTAPESINMAKLREAIAHVEGVKSFHGLHIWQLNDEIYIGSVHIVCSAESNHQAVMDDVKRIFHASNIHSSTVQVEVIRTSGTEPEVCNDIVCNNVNCLVHHCCAGQVIKDQIERTKSGEHEHEHEHHHEHEHEHHDHEHEHEHHDHEHEHHDHDHHEHEHEHEQIQA